MDIAVTYSHHPVPIERSMGVEGESGLVHPTVHDEYIVSLLDGKRYKVLTPHLTRLGYTAASYREKFGLSPDYPMVAAEHSRKRSAISKQTDFSNRWNQYKNKRRSEL